MCMYKGKPWKVQISFPRLFEGNTAFFFVCLDYNNLLFILFILVVCVIVLVTV